MAIKEEKEKDLERVFDELYVETNCMVTKSKELKEQLEAITKENVALDEKHRRKEAEFTQFKEKGEKLQHKCSNKEKDINKIVLSLPTCFYIKKVL